MKEAINKDLILRERLALQRTTLANQTTVLAFIRTAMYFFVAGLSSKSLLKIDNSILIEISFYTISFAMLIFGLLNFFKHRKMITENRKHIGNYKLDYYE
jgi:putative membrane protein